MQRSVLPSDITEGPRVDGWPEPGCGMGQGLGPEVRTTAKWAELQAEKLKRPQRWTVVTAPHDASGLPAPEPHAYRHLKR